jgi:chorismate synthase
MTFRYLTAGESHGKCLTAIIEGIPAGFEISEDFINKHLARRQVGYGRGGRMQIEKDTVEIKSGVRFGITTGAPICLEIKNKDWENWQIAMSTGPVDINYAEVQKIISEKQITQIRPGHADLAGALKYNQTDVRNILERSSARETAARVAVGAVAMAILEKFGIEIFSHVTCIGSAKLDLINPINLSDIKDKAEKSDLRCIDDNAYEAMKKEIDRAKEQGDTLGGLFEVILLNTPVGLGSHVHWDRRLDGLLAQAVMSIPAVKSVEIGLGKDCAFLPGSQVHDEIFPKQDGKYIRKTNNAGGIEGGMSNGEPILIKIAMKAIPTMKKPLKSVDIATGKEHLAHFERSDTCAVAACAVVAEAMAANTILQVFLEKFGGDSFKETKINFKNYS